MSVPVTVALPQSTGGGVSAAAPVVVSRAAHPSWSSCSWLTAVQLGVAGWTVVAATHEVPGTLRVPVTVALAEAAGGLLGAAPPVAVSGGAVRGLAAVEVLVAGSTVIAATHEAARTLAVPVTVPLAHPARGGGGAAAPVIASRVTLLCAATSCGDTDGCCRSSGSRCNGTSSPSPSLVAGGRLVPQGSEGVNVPDEDSSVV